MTSLEPPPLQSKTHSLLEVSVVETPWGKPNHDIVNASHSKLGSFKPKDHFGITKHRLLELVDFDKRNSPELLSALNSKEIGGIEGVARSLNSNLINGLSTYQPNNHKTITESENRPFLLGKATLLNEQEVLTPNQVLDYRRRIALFGSNVSNPPKGATILGIVFETIKEDPIVKILLVGATVVLILGCILDPVSGYIDGVAITIAVFIVLSVTAGNDYSKDLQFRKLLLLQSEKKVKVVRNGIKDQISSWDIYVGDLVRLDPGDEIPADGLFVEGDRMLADESPLTGEPIAVKKNANSPFMFSGTQISEGKGMMIVTSVGENSSAGKIQKLLSEEQNVQTPLQAKLAVVAEQIGKVGIASGIMTFLGLLISYIVDHSKSGFPLPGKIALDVADFFVTGVTVVVVAVPEGLPLAVTISLALSMMKMIKDKCFVRHLQASETMGSATCICTDKTGTLTENRMCVVKFSTISKIFNGDGSGERDSESFSKDTFSSKSYLSLLSEGISMNSTCFLKNVEGEPRPVFVGSATEGALLVFLQDLGIDYNTIRDQTTKLNECDVEFTSAKKRMSTTIETKNASSKYRVHIKGASEIMLKLCKFKIGTDSDEIRPITSEDIQFIERTITFWASEGLRTIVMAFKNTNEKPNVETFVDNDLVFLGLAGIKDPIRKEVPLAVSRCQNAGIVVRMVTGDNILTAKRIASECNILSGRGIAMEGPEFRALSEAEKINVLPILQVLARSSPSDKFDLVSLLKKQGEVVAVTGDGTNDAPALKEADVGFAMGICGTQIALNASDIMLLDDNFSSIVQAIKWGRNVLEVIRRFVQFQLICNLSAILITFIGSCTLADHKSPITPVQLLWVNLIMDSLGALALATDEPEDDILDRKPTARTDALITKKMKEYIIAGAVYQVTLVLFVLYSGYGLVNVSSSNSKLIGTLAFNTFVLLQVTNEVMARQLHHELNFTKNIFRNKLFLSILIVIGFIQFIMIQWGGSFVETVVLSPLEWALCIIIAAAYIPYCLGTRIIFRLNEYFYDRRQPMPTALSRAKSVNSTKSATSNRALDVGTPKTKLPPLPGQSQKNVSTASLSSKSAKIIVTGTITADNSNTAVTAAVKEALDEKDIPDRSSRNIIAVDAELKPKNVEVSNVESLPLPGVAE